jgi:hypothetical protein
MKWVLVAMTISFLAPTKGCKRNRAPQIREEAATSGAGKRTRCQLMAPRGRDRDLAMPPLLTKADNLLALSEAMSPPSLQTTAADDKQTKS